LASFYSDETSAAPRAYRIGAAYEPYLSTMVGLSRAGAASLPTMDTGRMASVLLVGSQRGGRSAPISRLGVRWITIEQNAKNARLFTNNTWHATDALDLTLGVRYTREEKTLDSDYRQSQRQPGCGRMLGNPTRGGGALIAHRGAAAGGQLAACREADRQASSCLPWANALHNGRAIPPEARREEWSGTLKAAYRWNEHADDIRLGARGYKAGGFNLDRVQSSDGLPAAAAGVAPVDDTSFPGEFVDSYELGAKTTWADGNLLINATLFHQTYKDFQLNSFLGTSFVVALDPRGGIAGPGFRDPVAAQGPARLMLQGGVMYADTKYADHIPGADFANAAPPANPGPLYKLPGRQMAIRPKWSISASATYDGISAPTWSGTSTSARSIRPSTTVVRTWTPKSSRRRTPWPTHGWASVRATSAGGRTVEPEPLQPDYYQVAFDGPLQAVGSSRPGDPVNTYDAFPGAPRTYGMTFRVSY
jgi:outer membrane receptor protein involved in Fe transport